MKDGTVKKIVCGIVLGISILFTLVGFPANVTEKKRFTGYSVSPLVAKASKAELLSDERKKEFEGLDYESEDMKIYEVHIEYENISDYTWNNINLTAGSGNGGYVKMIRRKEKQRLADAEREGQVIPAGKTGTVVCYLAAEPDTSRVMIEEYGELLDEENNRVMVNLPFETGDTAVWTAE